MCMEEDALIEWHYSLMAYWFLRSRQWCIQNSVKNLWNVWQDCVNTSLGGMGFILKGDRECFNTEWCRVEWQVNHYLSLPYGFLMFSGGRERLDWNELKKLSPSLCLVLTCSAINIIVYLFLCWMIINSTENQKKC